MKLFRVSVRYRPADGWMGRWGGGWSYKLGVQGSSRSMLIMLVWFSVLIAWGPEGTS